MRDKGYDVLSGQKYTPEPQEADRDTARTGPSGHPPGRRHRVAVRPVLSGVVQV